MNPLSNIWTKLTSSSALVSIEHCFGVEATALYGTTVKKSKGEIQHEQSFTAEAIDALKEKELGKLPMVVTFTGRKVLSKVISTEKEESLLDSAKRAFPNMDISGLYFTKEVQTDTTVVSATRKDLVDDLLNDYQKLDLWIIDMKIGVQSVLPMAKTLEVNEQNWHHHQVDLEQLEVNLVENPTANKVSVSDEEIDGRYAVAFLSGLVHLVGGSDQQQTPPQIQTAQSEFGYVLAYKRVLPVAIASLFILLLSSFLVFSHYFGENQSLQAKTAGTREISAVLAELKEQVKTKEIFLATNASDDRTLSLWTDKIGETIPKDIELSGLTCFPLTAKHKREQLYEFDQHHLEILGTCGTYSIFQQWMNSINDLDFIEKIEVMGFEETESSKREQFHLRLTLRL